MPEPVIAAPAAPASPAPAPAPSSSPAASPAATAPAIPAAPSTTGAAPAAPSGPQPPAKLNPKEFQNASDAYMAEAAWKQQLAEFKQQNPDVKIDDDSPWPVEAKPAEQQPNDGTAPEAETKPAEEQKPEEQQQATEEVPEPFTM